MPDILHDLADHPRIDIDQGAVLIREGDAQPALFLLVEGTVGVYRGDIRVSRTARPGALFGEMAALLSMPASATVVAETPLVVVRVDDALGFLGSRPDIALHTASLLAQRLYDATTYLVDLKRQFEGEDSHLGMVDRVLGSLLNQQLERKQPARPETRDPRL